MAQDTQKPLCDMCICNKNDYFLLRFGKIPLCYNNGRDRFVPRLEKNEGKTMKKATDHPIITLCQDHVYFGGMQLTYRLLLTPGEVMHRYSVSISLCDETCEAEVGNDLLLALSHYQCIREGRVTPCGLDDVMQELRYA